MLARLATALLAVALLFLPAGTTRADKKPGPPPRPPVPKAMPAPRPPAPRPPAPRPPAAKPAVPKPPAAHPILHAAQKAGGAAAHMSPQHKAALEKHVASLVEKHHTAVKEAQLKHDKHLHAAAEAEKLLAEARRKAVTPAEKAALVAHEKRFKEAQAQAAVAHHEVLALEAQHKRVHAAMTGLTAEQVTAIQSQPGPAALAIANELHWVRVLLDNADHDYAGHRAAAVGQISKAIGHLAPGVKFGDKDQGGNPWPQSMSDVMLGQALQVLAGDAAFTTQLPVMPRTQHAFGHINTAIRELEVALTIK